MLTNRSVTRLTNGNVTRSTNVNLSSFINGNIPNMTDANRTKLLVSGCTRVIQKNRLRWRDAQILLSLCIRVFYLKRLRSRAIKTKTRGVTWMVNITHTVWIIQTFEILKWQLFFQNAFLECHYLSAPSLKMDTENTTSCRRHSMIACQVSWISDEFWIY